MVSDMKPKSSALGSPSSVRLDTVAPVAAVDRAEATRTFARIGLLSFGGPAAQIAVMHRILVDEKRWLTEPQFLHALNFCMLLPGPEAMQLATYAGWKLHGVRGGLIAGLLFILPGFAMMLALSAAYVLWGETPVLAGLFFGLKAAVLAVVAEALLRVGRRALKSRAMVFVAVAAFVAIALVKAPFPVVVLGAGLIGAFGHRLWPALFPAGAAEGDTLPETSNGGLATFARTVALWLAVWLVPLGVIAAVFGARGVVSKMTAVFFWASGVTFGGALAGLAWVGQQAVEAYGWLSAEAMIAGLGLAETTLGPLVLVLVFVGFVGGAAHADMPPLAGGLIGGTVAMWFTFAPCFLWIFAGAPHVERLRRVRWLSAAMAAITPAGVGALANLALWFGLHVLFGEFREVVLGPLWLPAPSIAGFDWRAGVIALSSAVALLRFHVAMPAVLGAAAIAGMALTAI